jgi:hypothetical protein
MNEFVIEKILEFESVVCNYAISCRSFNLGNPYECECEEFGYKSCFSMECMSIKVDHEIYKIEQACSCSHDIVHEDNPPCAACVAFLIKERARVNPSFVLSLFCKNQQHLSFDLELHPTDFKIHVKGVRKFFKDLAILKSTFEELFQTYNHKRFLLYFTSSSNLSLVNTILTLYLSLFENEEILSLKNELEARNDFYIQLSMIINHKINDFVDSENSFFDSDFESDYDSDSESDFE